jgi:hypothetical protein
MEIGEIIELRCRQRAAYPLLKLTPMKTFIVLATLLSTIPAFAAGSSYTFTGTSYPAAVQKKITSSANRAVKREANGPLTNATINMSRGTAIQAKLTGTDTLGNSVEMDAQFKIATSPKKNLSVTGIRSTSRAYVGKDVTSPVWNLVASGPK